MCPLISRVIHLISGTAKTGKDTLHRMLTSGRLRFIAYQHLGIDYARIPLAIVWPFTIACTVSWIAIYRILELLCLVDDANVFWYVFGTKGAARRADTCGLFTRRYRCRHAFADSLKSYCNLRLLSSVPEEGTASRPKGQDTNAWLEQHKDDRIIAYPPGTHNGDAMVTPRQIYIQIGASERRNDPDVWARRCFDMIERTSFDWEENKVIDITDHRFRNESVYAKRRSPHNVVFTTRLYRGIKPSDDPSEHDLDDEIADFLMVGSMWHYVKYIWAHPEYARHNIIGEMQYSDIELDQPQ